MDKVNNPSYSLYPDSIMNVNKYSCVKGNFLNINRWAFTLLHIKWGFVCKMQSVKFHPEMYNFGPIKN